MLKGNVTDFPLVSILQMLERDARTGSVRLEYAQGALISVIAGKVVHAVYPPSKGERALSLISSFQNAAFEFFENKLPNEQTVKRPMQLLLMELHSENLEWKKIRNRLKNWTLSPQWAGAIPNSTNPERLEVIGLINGTRNIEDIIHTCDLPPRRAAEILVEFTNERLVLLGSASEITQPLELMVLPIFAADEATIFVDQGLYNQWKAIYGTVLATVITQKGERQMFRVKGRENSLGRVQLADIAVRKLKLARGVKVRIVPSGGTR
ncbi:MAG: hypothetical protein RLZZ156_1650 [Deinococcota bacterium]